MIQMKDKLAIMVNLKKLFLVISQNNDLTDRGVISLVDLLDRLPRLTEFSLDVSK